MSNPPNPPFGGNSSTPFGSSTAKPAPAFGSTTPVFGSTTTAPAFGVSADGTKPSSSISSTTPTSPSSTPFGSHFGSTSTTSGFGAVTGSGFGSSTNAFGSQASKFAFGSTATPGAFGTSTTSAFGSSAFGAASSPTPFGGATAASTPPPPTPFGGGKPMPQSSAFGSGIAPATVFGGRTASPASSVGTTSATSSSASPNKPTSNMPLAPATVFRRIGVPGTGTNVASETGPATSTSTVSSLKADDSVSTSSPEKRTSLQSRLGTRQLLPTVNRTFFANKHLAPVNAPLKTLVAKHVPNNLLNQNSLQTYFSKFGHVESVVIKPEAALITFSTHEEAEKALNEASNWEGVVITLLWAKAKNPSSTKQDVASEKSLTAEENMRKMLLAKIEAEKKELEQKEKEKRERDRKEMERKRELAKKEAEKNEAEKNEQEKGEEEKKEQEKKELEKQEAAKQEQERKAQEKAEKERLEREKLEKEKQEKEQREKEKQEKEKQDKAKQETVSPGFGSQSTSVPSFSSLFPSAGQTTSATSSLFGSSATANEPSKFGTTSSFSAITPTINTPATSSSTATSPFASTPPSTTPFTTALPTSTPVTTAPSTTAFTNTAPSTTAFTNIAPATTTSTATPFTATLPTTASFASAPPATTPFVTTPSTTASFTTTPSTTTPFTSATPAFTTTPATTAPFASATPASTPFSTTPPPTTTTPPTASPFTTAPPATSFSTTPPATTTFATTSSTASPFTTAPPTTLASTNIPSTGTAKPFASTPPATVPISSNPPTSAPSTSSTTTSSTASLFGAGAAAPSVFGTGSAEPSIFGAPSTAISSLAAEPSIFGASAATGPSIFGAASASSLFGATSSIFGKPSEKSSASAFSTTPASPAYNESDENEENENEENEENEDIEDAENEGDMEGEDEKEGEEGENEAVENEQAEVDGEEAEGEQEGEEEAGGEGMEQGEEEEEAQEEEEKEMQEEEEGEQEEEEEAEEEEVETGARAQKPRIIQRGVYVPPARANAGAVTPIPAQTPFSPPLNVPPRKPKQEEGEQHIVGQCLTMCPEKEVAEREVAFDLAVFEIKPGEMVGNAPKGDRNLCVKKYRRNVVGVDAGYVDPNEVRPPHILKRTMDHLAFNVLDRDDVQLPEVFNFVRDRTRGIRQDFTYQHRNDELCVEVHEWVTRFHILAEHVLCDQEKAVFDEFQNMEQLGNCLISLRMFYNDLRYEGRDCPNEPEFRAYFILINLGKKEDSIGDYLVSLPRNIYHSPDVQLAIKLYSAYKDLNYVLFFKLARQATYLMLCLLLPRLNSLRTRALDIMRRAYKDAFPLEDLARMLGFANAAEAGEFCKLHSIPVTATTASLNNKIPFTIPEAPITPRVDEALIMRKAVQRRSEVISQPSRLMGAASVTSTAPMLPPMARNLKPSSRIKSIIKNEQVIPALESQLSQPATEKRKQPRSSSPTPFSPPPSSSPFPPPSSTFPTPAHPATPEKKPVAPRPAEKPPAAPVSSIPDSGSIFGPKALASDLFGPKPPASAPPSAAVPSSAATAVPSAVTPAPPPSISPPLSSIPPVPPALAPDLTFPATSLPPFAPPPTLPDFRPSQLPDTEPQFYSPINSINPEPTPQPPQPLSSSSSRISPPPNTSLSSSSKLPRPDLTSSSSSLPPSSFISSPMSLSTPPTSLATSSSLSRSSLSSSSALSRSPPPISLSPPRPTPEELRAQKLREEEEERKRKEEHEARIAQVVHNICLKWRFWAPMNRKRRERRQFEQFVRNFNESAYVASPRESVAKLSGTPNFNTHRTKLKFSPFPPPPRIKDVKATNDPINLPRIIYGNLESTNPSAKILFWKIVICTPANQSAFVDWLAAKFARGPAPALADFPRTLALYHARDFYFEVPGGDAGEEDLAGKELKVCVTHVRGLPNKNDLAGAQAILNLVENKDQLALDNIRTISYLLPAPVPLAVVLFNFDLAQKKDQEWVQNVEQCVGDVRNSKKVKEAQVIKMAERSDAKLQDALKWLSVHSPAQPNLVRVDAGTLLDNLLAQQVAPLLTSYYSLSSPSPYGITELCSPQDVIDAYNELVSRVESQLTLDMDHGWSWPIPEFISTNSSQMPPMTWNKPETLASIRNAFRAISMRALPREFQSCVATQVFSVAPKSTTIPQLQTKALAALYEATLQVLHLGPDQPRSASAPLIHSVQNLFTQQSNTAKTKLDEITIFPWHRIFSLFFCYLVDSLTANDLQIFSLAKNIPTATRPPRRKLTSECIPLILPLESPRSPPSEFADDTPTLKRKLSVHEGARQQKLKITSPAPSRPPPASPYESMLAERFSTYVAHEREQSRMFDELMRDMIGELRDDTPMNDVPRQYHNDLDILMQELEREKSKYERLERQLHNLH